MGDDGKGSCFRVPAMHDPGPTGEAWRSERSPVDVEGCSVTEQDVGWASLADAVVAEGSGRLAPVPPHRVPGPGVIAVGPDEEEEALPEEFETWVQVIDGQMAALRFTQHLRVHSQFHDYPLTPEPGFLKRLERRTGLGERLVSDEDPGLLLPGLGRGLAGQHHDAAAELRWPWHWHRATVPEGCSPDIRRKASLALTSGLPSAIPRTKILVTLAGAPQWSSRPAPVPGQLSVARANLGRWTWPSC